MDFKLLIGAIGLLLITGCGCVEKGEQGEEQPTGASDMFTFTLNVTEYRPHCGGMAPSPEMELNATQPVSGGVFYLYEGLRPEDKGDYTRVVANGYGVITIQLKSGNYGLVHPDKLLTLSEFIALKKIEGIHYVNKDDSCYEAWRNRTGFGVHLVSDSTMNYSINYRCFTGANPCLEYIGPYPP